VSAGLQRRIARPAAHDPVSIGASLAAGLRAAWASPTVRAVLLCTIAMNVLFFPYQHMLAVFARDVLGGGPGTLGALVAADGLGALAGALAIAASRARLAHPRVFAAGVLVAPVLLVAFAAWRWLPGCLALLVLLGVAESAFAAMQSTLVLLSAPAHARGGTMGLLSACIGSQPLGTLAIGAVTGALGAPLAFTAHALAALAVMVPLALPLARSR
jgi:Na+/melibiose symporter-like transporter